MIALLFFLYAVTGHCPPGYREECIKPKLIGDRSNTNGMYFHEGTFGIYFGRGYDPCEIVTTNSNYKDIMNKYIVCKGPHCINDKFGCKLGDSQNCYNVEHIYDKKGCRYNGNEANIMANLVMAWGKWNQNVSHTRIGSCAAAEAEKEKVYGKEMMVKVKGQIEFCKRKRAKRTQHDEAQNNNIEQDEPILIDESNDEQINGFDYSECDAACTCESNRHLDILCGCDYSETEFDPSCQAQTLRQAQSNSGFYREAFILSNAVLILTIMLLAAALIDLIRKKNKGFDIPPEFDLESHEL